MALCEHNKRRERIETLSDKRIISQQEGGYILTRDVKEFIKKLKEYFEGTTYHDINDFMIFLEELAGKELSNG